jgi:hypothetical protein
MRTPFVILVTLGLVLGPATPVLACVGGEGQQTYVDADLTASPMNRTLKSFSIAKDKEFVVISLDHVCWLRILNNTEKKKLDAGENFTALWPDGGNHTRAQSGKADLSKGKYWVVLINDEDHSVSVHIYVYRPAEMCASTPMLPEGIQFGGMAIIILLALLITVMIRKRRT